MEHKDFLEELDKLMVGNNYRRGESSGDVSYITSIIDNSSSRTIIINGRAQVINNASEQELKIEFIGPCAVISGASEENFDIFNIYIDDVLSYTDSIYWDEFPSYLIKILTAQGIVLTNVI